MNHSIEAEQAVIGGLMLDPEKLHDVLDLITHLDFYVARNRVIFRAIHMLASTGHPIDAVTVSESLQAGNKLDEIGGMGFIIQLAESVSSTSNLVAYARIIGEKSLQRKIVESCQNVIDATSSGQYTTQELITHAQSQMAIIDGTTRADKFDTFKELIKGRFEALDNRANGNVPTNITFTGFHALDERYGGMEPGEMIIIAGRPAMGKTTLALNIVAAAAKQGDVLVFSLEMTKEQLVDKLICAAAAISYGKYKKGELGERDWPMLEAGARKLIGLNVIIDDRGGMDVGHAFNIARKIAKNGNLKLIMIDYLQLMRCKSATRFEEVSEVSRQLKAMAKACACPVLVLSQLSRKCEEQKRRPISSDLRESGQLEQDADIISFIYRDEVYNPDSVDKGIAEIITTKNREGEVGTDGLGARLHESRFVDLGYALTPKETKQSNRGYD